MAVLVKWVLSLTKALSIYIIKERGKRERVGGGLGKGRMEKEDREDTCTCTLLAVLHVMNPIFPSPHDWMTVPLQHLEQ